MNQHQKLDLILEQQQDFNSEMSYVKGLLENNSKTGQRGAIKRIDDLEGRADASEVKDKVRMGKATVIGGFVGGFFVFVGKIILKFFI